MAKRFRTKEPGANIKTLSHGDVHDGNITKELYEELIKVNPNLAGLFREVDEEPKVKKESSKTKPTVESNG